MGSEWSRRRFLKGAGAGTLGLMALGGARLTPAAAGTLSRTRPRGVSGALSADPCDPGNRAKLGVFAEPEGSEVGYFGAFMGFQDEVYAQDYSRGVDIYRSYRSWGKPIFNPTIMNILNPVKNPYKTPDCISRSTRSTTARATARSGGRTSLQACTTPRSTAGPPS